MDLKKTGTGIRSKSSSKSRIRSRKRSRRSSRRKSRRRSRAVAALASRDRLSAAHSQTETMGHQPKTL